LKKDLAMLVIMLAIVVLPLSGFAGDTEVMFDYKVASDAPSSLKIAPDGKTAWVTTANAILRFTGSKRDEFKGDAFAGVSCGGFKLLAFDAKGTLWISLGCYKNGRVSMLATYDGSAWKLVTRDIFPLPEEEKWGVQLMAFDKNNVMWLVATKGLYRYDGKEWKLFNRKNTPIPDSHISALNIDKSGAVWIGTAGGHIAKFDGTRWEVFKSDDYDKAKTGLTSNSAAKSIKFDRNGVMYFTNYGGSAYRYTGGKFQMIGCSYDGGSSFEDVAFDAQNVLWIANNRDMGKGPMPGLLRQDGKKCRSFKLPHNSSYWIEIDAAGNKWIASTMEFTPNGSITVFREGGVKLAQ
jgi:ligand-binding sensor domain-containing protein